MKTNHYYALKKVVWDKLDIGAELSLNLQNDKVILKLKDGGDEIGELSDEDSKTIKLFLDVQLNEIFVGRISFKDERADEDKRFKVALYIVNKNA